MTRFTHSILILIFSILSVSAQNNTEAQKVIDNLVSSLSTSAIKTNFRLSSGQKNTVNSQSVSGTFILKGNKFVLDTDGTKAWFDGKTQWTYVADSKEVSVTEPTESELADTNPLAILSKFRAKSFIRFSKTKSVANHIIELNPKSKKEEFSQVQVQINKATGNLVSIKLTDKKGSTTLLTLSNYQKGVKVPDNTFVFNKANYKGVTINDLR
ncbi:MAG: outer rane lipoprotein carrier protein LolA [Bacteroidetes bacterium]|nr:outer rane lipoprotein carrier protein LolA [Bacteroidota bacterium]